MQHNGLCHCGCGGLAPIAKYTDKRRGTVKGKPLRFINGHNPKMHPKWRSRKMKPAKSKDIVTQVYHRGTFIGGVQKIEPMMTLPPQNWQPCE